MKSFKEILQESTGKNSSYVLKPYRKGGAFAMQLIFIRDSRGEVKVKIDNKMYGPRDVAPVGLYGEGEDDPLSWMKVPMWFAVAGEKGRRNLDVPIISEFINSGSNQSNPANRIKWI